MDRCRTLSEYSAFMERVRKNQAQGADILVAVNAAVRHKAEVMDVVLTEYDEAKHMKLIEKEAEARGEAIGQARGEAIGQARGQIIGAIKLAQMNPNISDVEIVSSIMELFELPEDEAWEYFRSYK